jgi:hypothetical protein
MSDREFPPDHSENPGHLTTYSTDRRAMIRHLAGSHHRLNSEIISLDRDALDQLHRTCHGLLGTQADFVRDLANLGLPQSQYKVLPAAARMTGIGAAPVDHGMRLAIGAWSDGSVSVGGARMSISQLVAHIELCRQAAEKARELTAEAALPARFDALLADMISSKRSFLRSQLHTADELSKPVTRGRFRSADEIYDRELQRSRPRTSAELEQMYQENKDKAAGLRADLAALDVLEQRLAEREW